MRLLKLVLVALFAAVAVTMGLVAAAGIALLIGIFFAVRRLVGGARPRRIDPARVGDARAGDVIEVSATEVRGERLSKVPTVDRA